MSDLRIDPLSVAETDTLIAELRNRFPEGLLVVGVCAAEDSPGNELFFLDYYHGLTMCIGLAERARARLVKTALTVSSEEE